MKKLLVLVLGGMFLHLMGCSASIGTPSTTRTYTTASTPVVAKTTVVESY